MRDRYEKRRIQKYKRAARTDSGRTFGYTVSVGKKSCEQHRAWCSESKPFNDCYNAVTGRTTKKTFQGIAKFIDVILSKGNWQQKADAVSRRREYINSVKLDLNSFAVNFFPIYGVDEISQKRRCEAIQVLVEVIRLSSKRGRNNGINSDGGLDEAA